MPTSRIIACVVGTIICLAAAATAEESFQQEYALIDQATDRAANQVAADFEVSERFSELTETSTLKRKTSKHAIRNRADPRNDKWYKCSTGSSFATYNARTLTWEQKKLAARKWPKSKYGGSPSKHYACVQGCGGTCRAAGKGALAGADKKARARRKAKRKATKEKKVKNIVSRITKAAMKKNSKVPRFHPMKKKKPKTMRQTIKKMVKTYKSHHNALTRANAVRKTVAHLEGHIDDDEDQPLKYVKTNSVGKNRIYGHKRASKLNVATGKVMGAGYTPADSYTGAKGHYYLGPSRRRIGAGFGRRRRTHGKNTCYARCCKAV